MDLESTFDSKDYLNEIDLSKWERSISSFARAGRLTARLVVNGHEKKEIGPFCGNSLGKFLYEEGALLSSSLREKEDKLASEVLKEGVAKEILLFDFLRLAVYPLKADEEMIGFVAFGYAIDRFVSSHHVKALEKALDLNFTKLWRAIRNDTPLSDERFISVGELAENLSIQIIDEWMLKIKLQDALKAKDLFLSSVTHELRTPLQALLLNVELLELDLPNNSSITGIKENIQNLDKLINQLFDYARLTRQKVDLDIEEANLINLIGKTLKPYEHQATIENKHLMFDNKIDSDLVAEVDQLRLSQVVSNLVGNALKFTAEGDDITLSLSADESNFFIKVKDTGEGIQADSVENVFKKFNQGEKEKRTSTGLGLGLSICKEITHLHGGDIKIHSEGLGKGTSVDIIWPVFQNTTH